MSEVELPRHCDKCKSEECVHLLEWQGTVVGAPSVVTQQIDEFLAPLGYRLVSETPYPVWKRGSSLSLGLVPYRTPTRVRAVLTPKGSSTYVRLQIVYDDNNTSWVRLIWEKSFLAEELRALILFLQTGYSHLHAILEMHRKAARAVPSGILLSSSVFILLVSLFLLILFSIIPPKNKSTIITIIVHLFVNVIAFKYVQRFYYRYLGARTGISWGVEKFSEFDPSFT